MSKIERLTKEQVARIPEFVERWTDIGLCTKPANRPDAERAVALAYKAAGLPPPTSIVWLGSPLATSLAGAMVRAPVRDQVWAQVWAQVWDQVWDQVWAQVRGQVWAQVWAQVRGQVWDQVWDQVGDQVWDQVGAQVRDQVWDHIYGQHDASWLSFYAFLRDVCSVHGTDKLDGLMLLAQSSGWALPFERICFISDRNNILNRDERGRLHCLNGPALAYPDGFAIYAVHGLRLTGDAPDYIDHPGNLRTKRIDAEKNVEVRRVLMELYGQARYLADSGAQEVASDARGVLYRKELPGDEPLVMVKLRNSTPEPDGSFKDYFLRVPPTMQTAAQAVAWSFDQGEDAYAPVVET